MTEYIKKSTHEHLIGKRARFKNNLKGYCSFLWNQEGTIQQLNSVEDGDLDYMGLSLVFDSPAERHKDDHLKMNSCYIMPDSIDLIEAKA